MVFPIFFLILFCNFKTKREANIPFFDKLAIHFASLLDPRRPYQDRQWAICMFDDLIEFGGHV
jgi:importin-5